MSPARLPMRVRLLLLVGLVLAGFSVLLAVVLAEIGQVSVGGPIHEGLQGQAEARYRLASLRADVGDLLRMSAAARSLTDPLELATVQGRIRDRLAGVKAQFEEVMRLAAEEPVRVALADARLTLDQFAETGEIVLEALGTGRQRLLARTAEMQELRQERLATQIASASDLLALREAELQEDTERTVARHLALVVLAGAGLALVVGGLTFLVARSITTPLVRLGQASRRIAGGDLTARAPAGGGTEMGQVALAFNEMAGTVQALQQEQAARIAELEAAVAEVRRLQGLLPICSYCKKIRDDDNYWHQVEGYLESRLDVTFTHGICPACRAQFFPAPGAA